MYTRLRAKYVARVPFGTNILSMSVHGGCHGYASSHVTELNNDAVFCAYSHTLYAEDATTDVSEATTEENVIAEDATTNTEASLEGSSLQTTVEEDFRAWESLFNQGGESRKFIEEREPSRRVSWKTAAEQGMPEAQLLYGYCFHYGIGVAKDCVESTKWIRKAAEQGNVEAQCQLGVYYRDGLGVAKDDAEAAKWFHKAAEQGHAEAQCQLGVCYRDGQGVVKDEAEAAKWFRKAAEQGHVGAQNTLGNWYAKGIGVPKDHVEAAKWFRKAAKQLASQISENTKMF